MMRLIDIIMMVVLLLTSCSFNKKSQLTYLPKVHITYENKPIEWLQGDATFTSEVNGVSNINYFGAKREDALKLYTVTVKTYSTLNITADAIQGLSKPKISAMLYNNKGEITSYKLLKNNSLNFDVQDREYVWMLYVDWGKGENNSIYWFKINAVKDKNNPEPRFTEPGMIPTFIIWKGIKYNVTGTTTKDLGEKLGVSEQAAGTVPRTVYKVNGYSPEREVAIAQLSNLYFKAVAFTAEEKENMLKQVILNDMYTFVTSKKFDIPNSGYDYLTRRISEEVDRLSSSDKNKYESITNMLKTGKYKDATDLIDKLQNTVSEVKY